MIYLILIWEFCKIGLFAVGGGPATIPFLMDLIDKYHWYSATEFTNLVAISQSTPGSVGINMATYSGYLAAGELGGILATVAIVFPSVVIIFLIAKGMERFKENQNVKGVFFGLRPVVAGLITTSALGIIKIALFTTDNGKTTIHLKTLFLFLIIFWLMQIKQLKKLHPGVWMLGAVVAGIVLF